MASMPRILGMEMSRTTMSAGDLARMSRSSSPSPASPTTSKSPVSTRILFNPCLTSTWSSARITRYMLRFILLGGDGNCQRYSGSAPLFRPNAECSSQHLGMSLHCREAEPLLFWALLQGLNDIKSFSIVFDGDRQGVVHPSDLDGHLLSHRMSCYVREGF